MPLRALEGSNFRDPRPREAKNDPYYSIKQQEKALTDVLSMYEARRIIKITVKGEGGVITGNFCTRNLDFFEDRNVRLLDEVSPNKLSL